MTRIEYMRPKSEAMREASALYDAGNNAGLGYDGSEVPERALRQVLTRGCDSEVDVYVMRDGSEVAVGDSYGPWAVTITPAS